MQFIRALAGLAAVIGMTAPLHAQDYPSKPVRLIVPFDAGGTMDTLGRLVSNQVNKQSNLGIFIENKPGANSMIGTAMMAQAEPDGHTLLNVSPSFVLVPLTKKNVPYDIEKDITPITGLGIGTGYLLVVRNDLPAKNVQELIALGKKSSKPLSYATPGIGNALHLASETFADKVDVKMLHVPYKGSNPAMTAVASGQVDAMLISPATVKPFVESGRVRAIAFTGSSRAAEFPNVPTMEESGVKDFVIKGTWVGWFAPAGTPKKIVDQLANEVAKAIKDPQVEKVLVEGGFEPYGRSPEEFAKFVRSEYQRYAAAVKKAGIEPR
jgi:tripartite-type tricarboxylate transporter receptor subunit TctC